MSQSVESAAWSDSVTHDERRDAILKSVGEVLRQKDVSKLSMQAIADRLGMTKGSLYYYYKNKHDMLFDYHMRASEEILRLLNEARSVGDSARAQLAYIIVGLVRSVIEDPYGAILVTELESLTPDQRRRYVAVRDQYEHRVRDLIRQGTSEGEFAPTDEKIAGFVILGAINWVSRWYDPAGPMKPEEIANLFSDLLVRGLRP